MLRSRKPLLTVQDGGLRLCIAVVFVALAGLSALAHADTRSVEGFDIDTVVLSGSDELRIDWSDANRLLIKGDAEDLDRRPFYVRGGTLYLGKTTDRRRVRGVKYLLEVNSLERIELEGSGTVWVGALETGELKVVLKGSGDMRLHEVIADELEVSLAGSGNIQLARARCRKLSLELAGSGAIDLGAIDTEQLEIDMSGSGDILASEDGSAQEVDVGMAGSGDVDVRRIRARTVDVGIAGSGDVYVWAEEFLDAGIIGSGDVKYVGQPELDTSILGSGGVAPID